MRTDTGVIYFVDCGPAIKIGFTTVIDDRLTEARTWSDPVVLAVIPGNERMEKNLHRRLKNLQIRREQFKPDPRLFALADDMVRVSKILYGVGMNKAEWRRHVEKTNKATELAVDIRLFEMWKTFGVAQ